MQRIEVDLNNSSVTGDGVQALREAVPRVIVTR